MASGPRTGDPRLSISRIGAVTGVLDVLGLVVSALDRAHVRYTIGGSLASSFAGEPRASLDADIVVEMNRDQVGPFVTALGTDFYSDEEALQRAVETGSSTNVIHQASGVKVDVLHSPEDILLQKLLWYLKGGEWTLHLTGLLERARREVSR